MKLANQDTVPRKHQFRPFEPLIDSEIIVLSPNPQSENLEHFAP